MEEPEFGVLKTGAIAMHELFTNYVEAGFTREEALALVIAHLTTATKQGDV